MNKPKTITARITIEQVTEGGLVLDMATAHIEGMGVRGMCQVPSTGVRQDAAVKALRGALKKAGIDDEPQAYYLTGKAAR